MIWAVCLAGTEALPLLLLGLSGPLVGVLLGHFPPATVLAWAGVVVLATTPLALMSSSVRRFTLTPESDLAAVDAPPDSSRAR